MGPSSIAQRDMRAVVRKASNGDSFAFREVVECYKDGVYAVAFKFFGERSLAEEATQETFIRLYRYFKKYESSHKFFTYLYRIAVNVCKDLYKRELRYRKHHVTAEDTDTVASHSKEGPEADILRGELVDSLHDIVKKLGHQQGMAYVLRDMQGLEIGEIAAILHCRQATVRSHLSRARRAIADVLRAEYPELIEGR